MRMTKTLLLILCVSLFTGALYANEAGTISREPISFLTETSPNMTLFSTRVTGNDLSLYAASRGGGGMGVVGITGAAMAVVGLGMWISGIPMVYFSGIGLKYWTDPKYEVYFLNDNPMWGLAGLYTGIAFIITGGVLFTAGIILMVVGFLGGGKSARIYHKIDTDSNTESIGISIKL